MKQPDPSLVKMRVHPNWFGVHSAFSTAMFRIVVILVCWIGTHQRAVAFTQHRALRVHSLQVDREHTFVVTRVGAAVHNSSLAEVRTIDFEALVEPAADQFQQRNYFVDEQTGDLRPQFRNTKLSLSDFVTTTTQWVVDKAVFSEWVRRIRRGSMDAAVSSAGLQQQWREIAHSLQSRPGLKQIIDKEVKLYLRSRSAGLPAADQALLRNPRELEVHIQEALRVAADTVVTYGIAHPVPQMTFAELEFSGVRLDLGSKAGFVASKLTTSLDGVDLWSVLRGDEPGDRELPEHVASFLNETSIDEVYSLQSHLSALQTGFNLWDAYRLNRMAEATVRSYPRDSDGDPIIPSKLKADDVLRSDHGRRLTDYEYMWNALNYAVAHGESPELRAWIYTQLENRTGTFRSQLWMGDFQGSQVLVLQQNNQTLIFDEKGTYKGTAKALMLTQGVLENVQVRMVSSSR